MLLQLPGFFVFGTDFCSSLIRICESVGSFSLAPVFIRRRIDPSGTSKLPRTGLWMCLEPLRPSGRRLGMIGQDQGCGITRGFSNHFCDTFGNPPVYKENSPWEALCVVSQKWSFPTALDKMVWRTSFNVTQTKVATGTSDKGVLLCFKPVCILFAVGWFGLACVTIV